MMTWSVDRSILGREDRLDGARADPGGAQAGSLLRDSGAAGKVWGLVPRARLALIKYKNAGKSYGLIIPALYNGDKSPGWEAGRKG